MKSKKIIVLITMLAVLAAALLLNAAYAKGDAPEDIETGEKILGEALFVGNPASGDAETAAAVKEDYYTEARLNRQTARDESCELLRSLAEDQNNSDEVRKKAAADLAKIADAIEKESNIESLVCAKGFERCLAVMGDESVTVMVSSDGLKNDELAQIKDIVQSETGFSGTGIKVIEIN